jgi:hypothetical protein
VYVYIYIYINKIYSKILPLFFVKTERERDGEKEEESERDGRMNK